MKLVFLSFQINILYREILKQELNKQQLLVSDLVTTLHATQKRSDRKDVCVRVKVPRNHANPALSQQLVRIACLHFHRSIVTLKASKITIHQVRKFNVDELP